MGDLVLKCNVCSNIQTVSMDLEDGEEMTQAKKDQLCVFRHDVLFVAKESIIVQKDVIYRLQETIVSDAMAIIFVCCGCSNWRVEGKEVQYSVPDEPIAPAAENTSDEAAAAAGGMTVDN